MWITKLIEVVILEIEIDDLVGTDTLPLKPVTINLHNGDLPQRRMPVITLIRDLSLKAISLLRYSVLSIRFISFHCSLIIYLLRRYYFFRINHPKSRIFKKVLG